MVRAAPARRSLPRAVWALGFTSFFADVGGDMVFPLLPVFLASLGAAPSYLGLVEGAAEAVSSGLKWASGVWADKLGSRRGLVAAGYAMAGLARPLMALATAPWHVLGVRLFDRVGKGIRTAPRDALIADVVEEADAGRAFGLHRAMDHAGAVVGPGLATWMLASGWGLRSVFLVALVPGALSVASIFVVPPIPPAARRHRHEENPPAPSPSSAECTRLPGRLRIFLGLLGVFALANASDAFLLLRANELGVPVAAVPLVWTMLHVSKLASSYAGGVLSDRFRREALILAGWVLYAGCYVALGFARVPWHVWGIFLAYGAHYGLTEPAEKALLRDLTPPHLRGRAYGAYHFVIGVTAVPAGLVTGALWERFGARVALGVAASTAALAALLLGVWLLQRRVA
jgi:MFS family permease